MYRCHDVVNELAGKVHGIDVLAWIMGDVESVYAKAEAKVRDIEVEDTCVALVTFKNGAFGVIEGTTSSNPGERRPFTCTAKKGRLLWRMPSLVLSLPLKNQGSQSLGRV